MENTKYNGWTNYATWRINLEMFDGGDYSGCDADFFKGTAIDILENDCPTESLAFDYAMAFLDEVNWHEIAENHKEA
jgi:hypothetical protein